MWLQRTPENPIQYQYVLFTPFFILQQQRLEFAHFHLHTNVPCRLSNTFKVCVWDIDFKMSLETTIILYILMGLSMSNICGNRY